MKDRSDDPEEDESEYKSIGIQNFASMVAPQPSAINDGEGNLIPDRRSRPFRTYRLVTPMLPKLLKEGARCSSVVRVFAHGAMGRRIDPSWGGPIELFLVPASAP